MSSYSYDCVMRCHVRVTLGYQLPCKGYFLTIDWIGADPKHGQARALYCWVDDSFSPGMDLNYFWGKLKILGIDVPDHIYKLVQWDAFGNHPSGALRGRQTNERVQD